MTVPNRAARPLHPFQLQPWSSGVPAVAAAGADAPKAAGEAPRVMEFLLDLDAVTYDLRQRVLDAGVHKHPHHVARVATWLRRRMRELRRLPSPAAKPR